MKKLSELLMFAKTNTLENTHTSQSNLFDGESKDKADDIFFQGTLRRD